MHRGYWIFQIIRIGLCSLYSNSGTKIIKVSKKKTLSAEFFCTSSTYVKFLHLLIEALTGNYFPGGSMYGQYGIVLRRSRREMTDDRGSLSKNWESTHGPRSESTQMIRTVVCNREWNSVACRRSDISLRHSRKKYCGPPVRKFSTWVCMYI